MASEIWESGERDLEEGREGNENICIYTIFSDLYNYKQFLYTCIWIKSEEASERLEESGERDIWERGAWHFFATVCYGAQLNQTLAILFILGY